MDRGSYHIQLQSDLIKLIKVLDECIDEFDNMYIEAVKESMLCTSNNN